MAVSTAEPLMMACISFDMGAAIAGRTTGASAKPTIARTAKMRPKADRSLILQGYHNLAPLSTYEAAAGVRHHIALSIVGIDRSDNGYFRAKIAQDRMRLNNWSIAASFGSSPATAAIQRAMISVKLRRQKNS
jgi:hypothetical protein